MLFFFQKAQFLQPAKMKRAAVFFILVNSKKTFQWFAVMKIHKMCCTSLINRCKLMDFGCYENSLRLYRSVSARHAIFNSNNSFEIEAKIEMCV